MEKKNKKGLSIMEATQYCIERNKSLRLNKNKNRLCLRVQGVLGLPVKFTSVDRVHRLLVPQWMRSK